MHSRSWDRSAGCHCFQSKLLFPTACSCGWCSPAPWGSCLAEVSTHQQKACCVSRGCFKAFGSSSLKWAANWEIVQYITESWGGLGCKGPQSSSRSSSPDHLVPDLAGVCLGGAPRPPARSQVGIVTSALAAVGTSAAVHMALHTRALQRKL